MSYLALNVFPTLHLLLILTIYYVVVISACVYAWYRR